MSRAKYQFILVFLICTFTSCKESSFPYKFENKPEPFQCNVENHQIFKEALYSFEHDLVSYYEGSDTLEKAYEVFINSSEGNSLNRVEFVSNHSMNVFRELKEIDNLWINHDSESLMFNYEHPIFECIEKELSDEEFKKTFKVLRENNSLSTKLIIPIIRDRGIGRKASNDKVLAMYISLDFFYHQMSHMFIPKKVKVTDE